MIDPNKLSENKPKPLPVPIKNTKNSNYLIFLIQTNEFVL